MLPSSGAFEKPIDYCKIPVGNRVVLIGPDAWKKCDADCRHQCHKVACGVRCKHTAGDEPCKKCKTKCEDYNRSSRKCHREDDHVCSPGVTCNETCSIHFSPEDYDKAPAFITCKVLPPQNIRFPILRLQVLKKRESFHATPLCRTCAYQKSWYDPNPNVLKCEHTNEERSFSGIFCSIEISRALELGYTLLQIGSCVFYPNYRLDLYHNIFNIYACIKTTGKGFPSDVKTPEEKHLYVERLKETTGLQDITVDMISESPARVKIAKILLNASIGKLG